MLASHVLEDNKDHWIWERYSWRKSLKLYQSYADENCELGSAGDKMMRNGSKDGILRDEVVLRRSDALRFGAHDCFIIANDVLNLQITLKLWTTMLEIQDTVCLKYRDVYGHALIDRGGDFVH